MAPTKNINWINVVKALSIILVFYVHSTNYYGYSIGRINSYIYPFYVNVFFFVSGYLLFRKQLSAPLIDENVDSYFKGGGGEYLFNIFYRIMLPSVLFAIVEYVPKNLLRGHGLDLTDFLWETLGGRTYWFTSTLVVAQVIIFFMLLSRCRRIWVYWLCSIFVMVGGFYIIAHDMNCLDLSYDLWYFKQGLLSVAFLTAGGLYYRYESIISCFLNKGVLMLIFVVYVVVFTMFDKYIHVLVYLLDVNWLGYIAGCLSSILLIEICKHSPKIDIMTYIGQNSISFYFMSGALPNIISMMMNKFSNAPSWYGLLTIWMLSLAMAYGATYLFVTYLPWLFDFRKFRKNNYK